MEYQIVKSTRFGKMATLVLPAEWNLFHVLQCADDCRMGYDAAVSADSHLGLPGQLNALTKAFGDITNSAITADIGSDCKANAGCGEVGAKKCLFSCKGAVVKWIVQRLQGWAGDSKMFAKFMMHEVNEDGGGSVFTMGALFVLSEATGDNCALRILANYVCSRVVTNLRIVRQGKNDNGPIGPSIRTKDIVDERIRKFDFTNMKCTPGDRIGDTAGHSIQFDVALILNAYATVLLACEEKIGRSLPLLRFFRGVVSGRLCARKEAGVDVPIFEYDSTNDVAKLLRKFDSRKTVPEFRRTVEQAISTPVETTKNESIFAVDNDVSPSFDKFSNAVISMYKTQAQLNFVNAVLEEQTYGILGKIEGKRATPLPYVTSRAIPWRIAVDHADVILAGIKAVLSNERGGETKACARKAYDVLTKIAFAAMLYVAPRITEFDCMYYIPESERDARHRKVDAAKDKSLFGIEAHSSVAVSGQGRCGRSRTIVELVRDESVDLQALLRSDCTVCVNMWTNKQELTSNSKTTESARTEEYRLRRQFAQGPLELLPLLVMLVLLRDAAEIDADIASVKNFRYEFKKNVLVHPTRGIKETIRNCMPMRQDGSTRMYANATCDSLTRTAVAIEANKFAEDAYERMLAVSMNHRWEMHKSIHYAESELPIDEFGDDSHNAHLLFQPMAIARVNGMRKDGREIFVVSKHPSQVDTVEFAGPSGGDPIPDRVRRAVVEAWRLRPARHDPAPLLEMKDDQCRVLEEQAALFDAWKGARDLEDEVMKLAGAHFIPLHDPITWIPIYLNEAMACDTHDKAPPPYDLMLLSGPSDSRTAPPETVSSPEIDTETAPEAHCLKWSATTKSTEDACDSEPPTQCLQTDSSTNTRGVIEADASASKGLDRDREYSELYALVDPGKLVRQHTHRKGNAKRAPDQSDRDRPQPTRKSQMTRRQSIRLSCKGE
jgi:hypothetical protein